MPPTSDILNRFHQILLQEISEFRPEYLTQPFTVAEIYQNLVPYRSHRDLIGVEMNGDYEDALLRLLAGEGDYLLLDSEVARSEIREELQSPNPNTGLFRDFAAADVRLNPDRILTGAGEASGESPDEALEEDAAASPDGTGTEGPEAIDIAELMPDEDDIDEEGDGDAGESGDGGVIGHIELADDGVPVPVPGTEPEHEDARSDDPPDISSLEDTADPVAAEPEEPEEPGEDADPVARRRWAGGLPLVPSGPAEPEGPQLLPVLRQRAEALPVSQVRGGAGAAMAVLCLLRE